MESEITLTDMQHLEGGGGGQMGVREWGGSGAPSNAG